MQHFALNTGHGSAFSLSSLRPLPSLPPHSSSTDGQVGVPTPTQPPQNPMPVVNGSAQGGCQQLQWHFSREAIPNTRRPSAPILLQYPPSREGAQSGMSVRSACDSQQTLLSRNTPNPHPNGRYSPSLLSCLSPPDTPIAYLIPEKSKLEKPPKSDDAKAWYETENELTDYSVSVLLTI